MIENIRSKHFLFVGNRLEVLQAMLEHTLNLTICIQAKSYAAQILQQTLSPPYKTCYYEFSNKKELLSLIESIQFDILVSNGCPYILPISQLAKPHHTFVNCHPSLLPNLKGKNPINGAILYKQPSGATCHIMTDEIDSGAVISQVPVYNDFNTPLSLLYQMCFLAEKEAFLLALKRDFKPLNALHIDSKPNIAYYTRQDDDLSLNFSTQSTQEIINNVKAFAKPNQMTHLAHNPSLHFIEAMLIKNDFLESTFQQAAINDVVLHYDNHILCKRKEGFLQLTGGGDMKDSKIPLNLSSPQDTPLELDISQAPIFHSQAYVSSLLDTHKKPFTFSFTQNNQYFSNTAIIEPIPHTPYYDMSSPYGYGGYMSNSSSLVFLSTAIKAQTQKAHELGIIAEFIRFHPFLPLTRYFAPLLDFFTKEKDIVIVSTHLQTRWAHYSSRLKGKLRKSQALLDIRQSGDIHTFITLYTQTMQRNNADSFYFFSPSYFQSLLDMPESIMLEARYKNEVVAMGIFLFDKLCGYYHLGANAPLSLDSNLNAMGALFEAFFEIAYSKGLQTCILGGGRSKDSADSLFTFKKQFATSIRPFYIGGYIYDKLAYQNLSADTKHLPFFLSYRFNTPSAIKLRGGGIEYIFLHIPRVKLYPTKRRKYA